MAVCINFNVCDNSPECSGIAVCRQGAIYWDEEKENLMGGKGMLAIDNDKCVSCGSCISEDGCPVGAIMLADTEEELKKIMDSIHIDPEKVRSLFVERYGAEPIDGQVCIEKDEIENLLTNNDGIVILEEFIEDSIQCLLSSIPIEEILLKIEKMGVWDHLDYYKCDVSDQADVEKEYPLLKIYRKGNILAEIAGYYDNAHKEMLWAELHRAIDGK